MACISSRMLCPRTPTPLCKVKALRCPVYKCYWVAEWGFLMSMLYRAALPSPQVSHLLVCKYVLANVPSQCLTHRQYLLLSGAAFPSYYGSLAPEDACQAPEAGRGQETGVL